MLLAAMVMLNIYQHDHSVKKMEETNLLSCHVVEREGISKTSIFCGYLFMSVTDTTDPQTEKSRYFSQLCHFCTKYLQALIK